MEENKTLEIVVPEGYEIDREKSTFEKIVFKPVEKSWRSNKMGFIEGYFIDSHSEIIGPVNDITNIKTNKNVFVTEKQAKSALAMAQISQLMVHDMRFGGVVTDDEWYRDSIEKYVIVRHHNLAYFRNEGFSYNFLAFHTPEQRELFYKENEDLVRDYLLLS